MLDLLTVGPKSGRPACRGSSSYRSITASVPRPTSAANQPAAVAVDRWDKQTDRRTDGRTDTRPFYDACRIPLAQLYLLLSKVVVTSHHRHIHASMHVVVA